MKRLFICFVSALLLLSGCGTEEAGTPKPAAQQVTRTTPAPTATPKPFNPIDIPTTEVDSSAISRIGYDSNEKVLLVQFKTSGAYYCYYDVPSSVWNEFKKADSFGKYFNANIKGVYDYERLS